MQLGAKAAHGSERFWGTKGQSQPCPCPGADAGEAAAAAEQLSMLPALEAAS